jgi:hypothetical protein
MFETIGFVSLRVPAGLITEMDTSEWGRILRSQHRTLSEFAENLGHFRRI